MKKVYNTLFLFLLLLVMSSGCSINKWAMNKTVAALSGSSSSLAFAGDDDPEMVGAALPLIIKTHELLLEKNPDNPQLLLATGSTICMYTYAFVQMSAEELPESEVREVERRMARAKKLYVRSRNYLLHALDVTHPGFAALIKTGKTDSALAMTDAADSTLLYWTGAAWMSAISANKSDMALIIDIPKAAALVERVVQLKETYDDGSAHEFLCTYYGSITESMGGGADKARHHFKRAVELCKNTRAGTYISLAASVCVNEQNITAYRALLHKALSIDLDKDPSQRLVNTLYQRRARWMLEHIGDFFLIDEGDME